jgi:hypothetical protein
MRTQEETEVAATAFRRGDPGYEDARRATCRKCASLRIGATSDLKSLRRFPKQ